MHVEFHGGSELQRRWFNEALESMEGTFEMARYQATPLSAVQWFPRTSHSTIRYAPIIVEVFWDSDPEPSVHNEWAYTTSTRRVWGRTDFDDSAITDPYIFEEGVEYVDYDGVIGIAYSHAEVRLKPDLHEKGEGIYKDVVRHEISHALAFASMTDNDKLSISNAFGFNLPDVAAAVEWWVGAGKPWADRGQEMDAEAHKDVMFTAEPVGGRRWSFSRARRKLVRSQFAGWVALHAARGNSANPSDPAHPYHGALITTRNFDGKQWGIDFTVGLEDTPPTPTPRLWVHHYTFGDLLDDDAAPDEEIGYISTDVYASDRLIVYGSDIEFEPIPGRQATLTLEPIIPVGFTLRDVIFQPHSLASFSDETHSAEYVSTPGHIGVTVRDAEGRICWMPTLFTDSPDEAPLTGFHSYGGGATEVIASTDLGAFEVTDPEAKAPFGWLHDPDEPLEPVLLGEDEDGNDVWFWRPNAQSLKLPLQIRFDQDWSGLYQGFEEPLVIDVRAVVSHEVPPQMLPPWPYQGSIKAVPVPPGSRENKPVMGAPGPATVIGT